MRIKFITILIAFCFVSAGTALGNGLSINNIGTKSLGMGGAFVGIADDFTAIYWNPAGLTQVKGATIGAFVTDIMPSGTYNLTLGPGINVDAKTISNNYIAPNIMGYLPIMQGDIALGLGIYAPSGLGAEWNGEDLKLLSGGKAFKWESKIGVIMLSPAFAYKFNDMFSLGATVNISYGMMDINRPTMVAPNTFVQYEETSNGMGVSFSVGAMIKPIEMLTIGLSIKSENKIAFSGTAKNPAFKALGAEEIDIERDISWPLWFGGGIALRPIDNLTIGFDVHFSQWSATQNKILTSYEKWNSQMTEEQRSLVLEWKDAVQIRFGAQYDVNDDAAIRVGFYTDPAPAPDKTLNILFPSISYSAMTVGGTMNFGSIGFDLGIEYMMGKDRTIALADATADNMPGTHGMNMFVWSLGVNYFFGK